MNKVLLFFSFKFIMKNGYIVHGAGLLYDWVIVLFTEHTTYLLLGVS